MFHGVSAREIPLPVHMSLPMLFGIVTLLRCVDPCRDRRLSAACKIRDINRLAACTRVTPQSSSTAGLPTVDEQHEDLLSESVDQPTRVIHRYVETRHPTPAALPSLGLLFIFRGDTSANSRPTLHASSPGQPLQSQLCMDYFPVRMDSLTADLRGHPPAAVCGLARAKDGVTEQPCWLCRRPLSIINTLIRAASSHPDRTALPV